MVTDEMVHQAGAHMEETDGLVDFLLACRDVDVAILLKQQGDAETKVSVRTLPEIDATRIVGVFGGGGHQRAAGCTISCHPEEAAQVLLPLARAELGGRRG
jgi:phosphoesterase RecJ-like protein